MAALEGVTPRFPGARDTTVARIEEETHTRFQKPKALYLMTGQGGVRAPDVVNTHATVVWEQANNVDYTLRRILGGPEPLEWIDDIPQHKHYQVLRDFLARVKKGRDDLSKYQTRGAVHPVTLVDPDEPIIPVIAAGKTEPDAAEIQKCCRHALDYLWKLRAAHRASFHDVTNSYRIHDQDGHEIAASDLLAIHEAILAQRLSSGEYSIRFEHMRYSSEQIIRMFMTTPGRVDWIRGRLVKALDDLRAMSENSSGGLSDPSDQIVFYERSLERWGRWQEHNNALAALHLWGPPHLEPRDHPWMSGARALEEIKDIRETLRRGLDLRAMDDEHGLWDILMTNRDQSEEVIDQLERHIRRMLKKYPFTPERKKMMGYHEKKSLYGDRNRPVEAVRYLIPDRYATVLLDVPDAILGQPFNHLDAGSYLIPVVLPYAGIRCDLERPDLAILFRAPEAGKVYLAARAVPVTIPETPWFDDLYAEVDARYRDAGYEAVRGNPVLVWFKVERHPFDTPITLRSPNPKVQTLKVRVPGYFDAMVSKHLSRKPVTLTGYIDRLDGPLPEKGMARLQEMVRLPASGDASVAPSFSETGWERSVTIDAVKSCTVVEFKKIVARSLRLHGVIQKSGSESLEDIERLVTTDAGAEALGFKNLRELRGELGGEILTHQQVMRMGYHSLEDARGRVRQMFSDRDRDEMDSRSEIVIVSFLPAEKSLTTYYHPPRRPDTLPSHGTLRPLVQFQTPLTRVQANRLWTNPGHILHLHTADM